MELESKLESEKSARIDEKSAYLTEISQLEKQLTEKFEENVDRERAKHAKAIASLQVCVGRHTCVSE